MKGENPLNSSNNSLNYFSHTIVAQQGYLQPRQIEGEGAQNFIIIAISITNK